MSLLFETIRLEDGKFHNLEFHNQRLNNSRKIFFSCASPILLEDFLEVPSGFEKGLFKCKLIYGERIDDIRFESYIPRPVASLRLVEDNLISYLYKFTDRTNLNSLFAKRGHCDDILIVKNGLLTDTSFSNVIFRRGMKWFTPAQPLLGGTMRAYLLSNKKIMEEEFSVNDLQKFETASLINAMLPFGVAREIPIDRITF
jgi:4-amino-4-deoxychorismate lyase